MFWTTKTVLVAAAILGGLGALGVYYQQAVATAPETPLASASHVLESGARLTREGALSRARSMPTQLAKGK